MRIAARLRTGRRPDRPAGSAACVGGWVFRRLGFVAPDNALGHVVVALAGPRRCWPASRADPAPGAGRAVSAPPPARTVRPTSISTVLARSAPLERRIVHAVMTRQLAAARSRIRPSTPTHVRRAHRRQGRAVRRQLDVHRPLPHPRRLDGRQRGHRAPFDPYPFILLNLLLSCVAALQAPVIMMSQNRQSAKDRSDARADYEVNVRAEVEMAAARQARSAARAGLAAAARAVDEQREALAAIQRRLDEGRGATTARRRD